MEFSGKRGVDEVDKQCIGEEGDSLIVGVHLRYMVRLVRQSIWGTKILAGNVFKCKVVF